MTTTCRICSSTEFELDAQESMLCLYCGTTSDEFLSQAVDVGDNDALLRGARRALKRQRVNNFTDLNSVKHRNFTPTNSNTGAVRADVSAKESVETYLCSFQNCLQYMANQAWSCISNINISYMEVKNKASNALCIKVNHIWHLYVDEVMKVAVNIPERILSNILPSKSMLLAFIYLSIRLLKMKVAVTQLLSWVRDHLIPYVNPLGNLQIYPDVKINSLTMEQRTLFICHFGHDVNPTSRLIWFHTVMLAKKVGIRIPMEA